MKDIAMLDKMYDMNKLYFKELSMYILAGKKKLAEVQATDLPAAQEKSPPDRSSGGRTGSQRPVGHVQPV